MTLTEIEQHARAYADARGVLAERVQALQAEIEAVKRRRLVGIKKAVAASADRHDSLAAAIQAAPELFARPRTKVLAGIRVGFVKQKGKLLISDADKTLQLIRRHFAEQADMLIKTTEKPVKKALEALSVAELKRIGVTVLDDGDTIMIRATNSEVDKLVNALLEEAEQIEDGEGIT